VKQVDEKEWGEVAHPIQLCELPLFPAEISSKYGVEFYQIEEMGLGTLDTAVLDIEGSLFWLQCPSSQKEIGIIVYARSFEKDIGRALSKLLKAFELKEQDLKWKADVKNKAT
jgi:hypothetical protein